MKQKIYLIGLAAAIIMATGAVFKVNHWPGAGIMMMTGTLILVLMFLPAALINHYKTQSNEQSRLLYLVTWITCLVIFTGMLFKIMHWPYAGIALLIALPFPYIVFLPVFLAVTAKNKNFGIYNTVFVLLLLALNSVFAALLSLNVSKEIINDSYKISANYCRIESAISDITTITASPAVNIKIDEIIKITNDYQDLILKNEGLTREQWEKNPGGLRRPDNANVAAKILADNGEMPAGMKLYNAVNELIVLMQQTKGYEEAGDNLPAILGLAAEKEDDPALSFSFRNIIIPLTWSLTFLDGVKADLQMLKVAGK
jgi:hypothetical protein